MRNLPQKGERKTSDQLGVEAPGEHHAKDGSSIWEKVPVAPVSVQEPPGFPGGAHRDVWQFHSPPALAWKIVRGPAR